MKKILLATVAATILTSSISLAGKGQFYAKGSVGLAKRSNERILLDSLEHTHTTNATPALKSNSSFFSFGGGYHLTETVRADAIFDRFSNVTYKKSYAPTSIQYGHIYAKQYRQIKLTIVIYKEELR